MRAKVGLQGRIGWAEFPEWVGNERPCQPIDGPLRFVQRSFTFGRRPSEPVGNFWRPTVIADVPLDARVFNEEPFGPIAAIRPFDTIDDAIAEANRLPFGLAGYAFTRSLKNADLLSRCVEVGMLWINTPALPCAEMPFGGLKDSGYGSEGGPEALEAYLNSRSVAVMNV